MKSFRNFIVTFSVVVTLGVGFQIWTADHFGVPIIMYHKVEDSKVYKTDTVSPEHFAYQMNFLEKHGYQVIPLDTLIEGIKVGHKFPRKTVVITFDDGYENNFHYAYPILRQHNFPATFFVVVGQFGHEGFMSAQQMISMKGRGIDFGSHTLNHAYLPQASAKEQRKEIFESKVAIERILGVNVKYLAYPIGGFNDAIKKLVVDAGYNGALTTNRGRNRFNKDTYELNRIRLGDHDNNWLVMTGKLSGFYNLFRKPKEMDGIPKGSVKCEKGYCPEI